MKRIKEFREQVIARCHERGACKEQYARLMAAKTPKGFIGVLLDNYIWCIDNGIYTASEMLTIPSDILFKAGIVTQESLPLDFSQPQELCGVSWMPFNVGASEENPYGNYLTFDEANVKRDGLRVPKREEFIALADTGSMCAIYHGVFGRVFGEKVFWPAAGYRYHDDGTLYAQSTYGYYWSSSPHAVSSANGGRLYFCSGGVYPLNGGSRANGLAVRCVLSN